MKQTAVEWQFEQFFNSFEKFNNGECTFNDYLKRNLEIREQALKMEKEQRGYSEEEVLEVFEHFKMDLPFHYEFLVKEHLQQLKQQEQ
jgi:hypothetical protein